MYNYEEIRPNLFTYEGQRMFLKIRDTANKLLESAGAFQMEKAWKEVGCGSSWDMLACVDRLVELREIREVVNPGCAAQHRVFVRR